MLKLQNRWANVTFFKKKITFPQKIPPDTRIAVETNWETIYRPSVFWIKLQRSVEESEKFQTCFSPQKLPRIPRLRVSKIWRKFLLEGKKLLRIGKNSECLSFEKIFSYIVPADIYCCFANPDKTFPPLSRKLQKLYENLEVFKTSFRKCCSLRVPLYT